MRKEQIMNADLINYLASCQALYGERRGLISGIKSAPLQVGRLYSQRNLTSNEASCSKRNFLLENKKCPKKRVKSQPKWCWLSTFVVYLVERASHNNRTRRESSNATLIDLNTCRLNLS